MMGEPRPYTRGLQFAIAKGGTGDEDESMLGEAAKGAAQAMGEKAKKALR